MNDQLEEYGLNLIQVMSLLILLVLPSLIGPAIITNFELIEIKPNITFVTITAFSLCVYFIAMMYFNDKLIGRLHDMVTLKYLVVIIVIFWICYDGYMAYIFQVVFQDNHDKIIRRDIVWEGVIDLPSYVIYPDLMPAYKMSVSALRFATLIFFAVLLMREKNTTASNSQSLRRRLRKKSAADFKATLHPSIMKNYDKDRETDEAK